MEPFTLDRNFLKQEVIDGFNSVIWTERYYGDSEVELVVPTNKENISRLAEGTFLGLDHSNEIMIIETANNEEGNLKVVGMSLLPWLNNRFVRATAKHEDKYWAPPATVPGKLLWDIVYNMCCAGSPYLNGTIPTGIPSPNELVIPGLGLDAYDSKGDPITWPVPYGPVYDALRDIATTYEIGMQITLNSAPFSSGMSYSLGFRSYRGLDRTSGQTVNKQVRFSPQMESLANIKELRSLAQFKTRTYAFAPEGMETLTVGLAPGMSSRAGSQYTGFDLRALMMYAQDITTDTIGGSAAKLLQLLNTQAAQALAAAAYIKTVDGEIVPTSEFVYGRDYSLGDVIEVQGNSDIIQSSRVVEYIRSQDEAGERAYPTVAMLD